MTSPEYDGITGPSSEPQDPVITAGPIASPVIRTGLQLVTGEFIVQGLEVWNVVTFDGAQRGWSVVAFGVIISVIQNLAEKIRGRRLIGTSS